MGNKNKFAGFTLIELLVTIVIIGILSTLSVATFNGYRERAINARRQAELKQSHTKLVTLCINKELDFCNELNMDKLVYDSSFTDASFWNTTNVAYGPNHWVIEDGVAKNLNNNQTNFDFLFPFDENGTNVIFPPGNYWMTMKIKEHPPFQSFGVVVNGSVHSFQWFSAYNNLKILDDGFYLINIEQSINFSLMIYNSKLGDLVIDDVFFYKK